MHVALRARTYLVSILVIAFVIRLGLFAYLAGEERPEYFFLGDTASYVRPAENLLAGHGFSQATAPPYLPDSVRTPLFPSLLAGSTWAFGSLTPIILLQMVLSLVLVTLAYKIALLVSGRHGVGLIAAALTAFEPYSIFVNTSILTETVFATLLIGGAYAALRFLESRGARAMLLASSVFGFAALVRPIAQFLPLLLVAVVLVRVPVREYAKYLVFAIVPFLIIIGPWLLRNQATFGVPALSSSGMQNAYSDLGGAIIAVRDRVPSHVAKQTLEDDFAKRYEFDVVNIQQDLSRSPVLFREAVDIMLSNPVPTLKVFTSITLTFFTHDAWTYYLQRWEVLPRYDITFSPSFILMTEGPLATLARIVEETGPTLLVPLTGRVFWVLISMLFLFGIGALVWRGGRERQYGLFMLALVTYLLALSASVGFGINGRFRYPVNAVFFTGAAIGGSLIVHWLRARYARTLRLLSL